VGKGLNAKNILKEIFPVYDGKRFSLKAVHNWIEKRVERFSDNEDFETELRKWLRQQSE
jgi:hypothetical protein